MKILFIQTGGTIDKDYPKLTSGYAFEIGESVISEILSKLNPSFSYEVLPFCKKDSTDITNEDRQNLLELIVARNENHIIITHGTDTLIETGRFLNDIQNKKIILTGAMRPQKFTNSDADINLGCAIGALHNLDSGAYIAMNGCIIKASQATRNITTGQFL